MCKANSSASRRRAQALCADPPLTLPPCPADGAQLTWAPLLGWLLCPVCGWHVSLASAEAADLADALAGLLPDLRLDLFVAALAGSVAIAA